ncbi:MAG TPA: hypothetical protein EYP56_07620 [Planctomycetaceae bacterium]|nr:hypothetical protein [Planctomycetaceae bacterium]
MIRVWMQNGGTPKPDVMARPQKPRFRARTAPGTGVRTRCRRITIPILPHAFAAVGLFVFPALAGYAANAVRVLQADGQTSTLEDARLFVESDDRSLQFVADRLDCVLVTQRGSHFVAAVPLSEIAAAGRARDGTFRVVTRRQTVVAGQLRTGFRGGSHRPVWPDQIAGFELAEQRTGRAALASYRTDWSVEVTDRHGCQMTLHDAFVLDQYSLDLTSIQARPTRQLGFRQDGLLFFVPVDRIASLERTGKPDHAPDWLEFPRGVRRQGAILTRRADFLLFDQPTGYDLPDEHDYLAGQRDGILYVVPLPDVATCRSTTAPESWQPLGPSVRLVHQQSAAAESIVVDPLIDLRQGSNRAVALSSLGALLVLRTGGTGYVGVPLSSVRSIAPASGDRVIVETRAGGVFAGQLLSTLQASMAGATVRVAPAAFRHWKAWFRGEGRAPGDTFPVARTGLDAEVVLAGGGRRSLSQVFLVHQQDPGTPIRLKPDMALPVLHHGVRYWIDLRHIVSAERRDAGQWYLSLRSPTGELTAAAPPVAADRMDFVAGREAGALRFVSIRFVRRIEVHASATGQEQNAGEDIGFPLSTGTLRPTERREVDVANVTFAPPPELPAARALAGSAPVLYARLGAVVRVMHLRAVVGIRPRHRSGGGQSQSVQVVGTTERFDAQLCGPVRAEVTWGRLEARPADFQFLEIRAVTRQEQFDLVPPGSPPVQVEIRMRDGQIRRWPRAWIADVYVEGQRLRVRFPSNFRMADGKGQQRDLPVASIRSISFPKSATRGAATVCILVTEMSSEPTETKLQLVSIQRGTTRDYGPITHDAIVGQESADWLDIVRFADIQTIRFLRAEGDQP